MDQNRQTEPAIEPEETDTQQSPEIADPIAALQADIEKFRDLALRSQADLDNYRKRAAREKEEAVRYSNASLIEDLLPVLDNFSLGLEAAKQSEGSAPILDGLGMVFRQLEDLLGNYGVSVIDAEGQPFDPNLHEALSQETSGDVDEGVVLRQIRRGYRLKDRLLRPANVVVSSGPAA